MMKDVMIDIETLATSNNALILTIGAIKWDRKKPLKKKDDLDKFYRRININSCKKIGLEINQETLNWWENQDEVVRYEALENNENRVDIKTALLEFIEWYGNCKFVWGNGDDFDCVIMTNAFEKCGLSPPWKFWETRYVRTLYDLGGVKNYMLKKLDCKAHNAIDDCYKQIYGCKFAIKKLGIY